MEEKIVKVTDSMGLHLRPATVLCQHAMEFDSQIMICFRSREYNAKSLLSILSACIQQGDEILLRCTGEDEKAAADALVQLLE